ncbi:unnamed protein product [Phytophthora lilii]|uniref:Unnamed protein product n=1 Tax=Phytophthora lilii TaxID=2077276 RepID=A0A9W6WVD9_9STRA|nr:unnamed protein product [Phytophthora lilii]
MQRGNRLLVTVAAVTAVLVLVQFALISEESATYFAEEEPQQLEATLAKKTPVFEQTTTLPVVLMHGMGDAAGNGGMMRIQKVVALQVAALVLQFNDEGVSCCCRRLQSTLESKFLPDINNEKTSTNQTYKENFTKLQNLVLVRANKDTQVFPKESEWFGAYQDNDPYKIVLGFNETRWYKEDLFGLQTLDKAGKVHFLSTDGDHLQFSIEFLLGVLCISSQHLYIFLASELQFETMASRDLVGRPLVPFFDSDENVNDSLQFAEGDDEREEMDVDARVWDKKLGYFVYPSEQQAAVSKPVAIAPTNRDSRTDSGSKLLLTPSMMLSSSAPEHLNSMGASGNPNSTSSKKGKSKGGNINSHGAQSNDNKQKSRNGKQKEQLSASGKWAWSAFQSSPDPDQLPMPPFLTKPGAGLSNGNTVPAAAPPLPPTPPPAQQANAPTAPPLPPGPPPSQPPMPPLPPMPSAPPEVTNPAPMSIELSMTQDLRRMLNIGGG